jgi:hypothetical protein
VAVASIVIPRLAAIVLVPTPLETDWLTFHRAAIQLATTGTFTSAHPPGWPLFLSVLYYVAGPYPVLGEMANLAFAVATGLITYALARGPFGSPAAVAAVCLWGLSPGPGLFTVALASEHLFTLLFVAIVALVVRAGGRSWRAWVPVGLALGLAHVVRPAGLILLPALLIAPFVLGLPGRRAALASCALLLTFGLTMLPVVAWQYQRYGRFTLSTSNYEGWNLLEGLNLASKGRWTRTDAQLVGANPETVEFRDRSYQLAIERLRDHPEAVFVLAVPKFQTMWGTSTYGATWTVAAIQPARRLWTTITTLASQLGYTIIIGLAAGFLWFRRRLRDPAMLVVILCLAAVAAAELFLEVQPRYHAFFEPLFCLPAGAALPGLVERVLDHKRRPLLLQATT